MKNDISYDYKPKPMMALLAAILFSGFAYGSSWAALTNERGLRLLGVRLDPEMASILLWACCACFSCVAVYAIWIMVNGLRGGMLVTLTNDSLNAPKSAASRKYVTIRYSDIDDMKLKKNSGKLFLYIHHPHGKLIISSAVFSDLESFQDLVKRLSSAANAVS